MRNTTLAYLASPYNKEGMGWQVMMKIRFLLAAQTTFNLSQSDITVYSPIVHNIGLLETCGIPNPGWDFWRKHDLNILARCDILYVLTIPGWRKSIGVKAKIDYARAHSIPIQWVYLHADGESVSIYDAEPDSED